MPVWYFNYSLSTNEGYAAEYTKNGAFFYTFKNGAITGPTFKAGLPLDLRKYVSNDGFTQLPRNKSRSSLEESLGKEYADKFWIVFTNGDGYFMTNKPFEAIFSNNPYTDITFRFRFNVPNFEGHNYNVVLNVYYGK